jgi:hypothetical protein
MNKERHTAPILWPSCPDSLLEMFFYHEFGKRLPKVIAAFEAAKSLTKSKIIVLNMGEQGDWKFLRGFPRLSFQKCDHDPFLKQGSKAGKPSKDRRLLGAVIRAAAAGVRILSDDEQSFMVEIKKGISTSRRNEALDLAILALGRDHTKLPSKPPHFGGAKGLSPSKKFIQRLNQLHNLSKKSGKGQKAAADYLAELARINPAHDYGQS